MSLPLSRSLRRRLTTAAAVLGCAALALTGCVPDGDPVASPKASVISLQPASGSVTGAQAITVVGSGLNTVAKVTFGHAAVSVGRGATQAKLVVTTPAASNYQPAVVPVTLLDKHGKTVSSASAKFTYAPVTGVDRQLQYALAHWQNYNSAQYGDLNPVGGDCANFVSQTLIARGWSMDDQWYNTGAADDWSPAWGYVPAMDEYFTENAQRLGLERLGLDQLDQVALGDIAMFDWDNDGSLDHVQVVTTIDKVGGTVTVKMASHNEDFDYRDLDQIVTESHPGATGYFWHLTR